MIIMIIFITLPVDYYITGRFITLQVDGGGGDDGDDDGGVDDVLIIII